MVTQENLLNMVPCNSLESKASFAAFAPLGFLFDGQLIFNPYVLPNGEATEPHAFGFTPVPGVPNKLSLTVPAGGTIFIEQPTEQLPGVGDVVTRVDANGRVLASALVSQLPHAGDLSIAKVAQRYITRRVLELLSFVFEGTHMTDSYASECGRFDASPLEYGFIHAADNNGSPCLIRNHDEGGHLQLSYVEAVDGAESGPMLTRFDAADNALASAMVSHIRAIDPELLPD